MDTFELKLILKRKGIGINLWPIAFVSILSLISFSSTSFAEIIYKWDYPNSIEINFKREFSHLKEEPKSSILPYCFKEEIINSKKHYPQIVKRILVETDLCEKNDTFWAFVPSPQTLKIECRAFSKNLIMVLPKELNLQSSNEFPCGKAISTLREKNYLSEFLSELIPICEDSNKKNIFKLDQFINNNLTILINSYQPSVVNFYPWDILIERMEKVEKINRKLESLRNISSEEARHLIDEIYN